MNTFVGTVVMSKTVGVLGPIADILGWIMDLLFRFTSVFGIENIALCIILFTLVIKLLMLPLTIKQQKSSKLMAVMQPEINAIQKKYKGKEQDQKAMMMQQAEMKAVYEKYGTSMTGGCLPMLIQLPILFALYRVIYNIPAYVQSVRGYYEIVVAKLQSSDAAFATSQLFETFKTAHTMQNQDLAASSDKVIDLLYKLTGQEWNSLMDAFPAVGEAVAEGGAHVVSAIEHMQTFLGLNIAYTPAQIITNFFGKVEGFTMVMVVMAVALPVLSGASQWFSTKLITTVNPSTSADSENSTAAMMKSMNVTMPLISVFFCFTLPVGVGIYWVAQSVFTIIQQLGINKYLNSVDIDDMVQKNVEKLNQKRAKKGLPPTRVGNVDEMMQKLQEKETKEEEKKLEKIAKNKILVEESTQYYNADAKPGSLASKAGMVAKYNEKHEKGGKK